MPCKHCEFEIYGWIMWDKDDPKGFDQSFFTSPIEKPTKPEEDQRAYGGDHQGHIWDSFPLYRKKGCIKDCED